MAKGREMGLVSFKRSFTVDIKTCKIFLNLSKEDATVNSEFIQQVYFCLGRQTHICQLIAPKWLK